MKTFFLKKLKRLLKTLAKATLWRYNPKIVGITGNVGKTSTKIAVEKVLSHKFRVRASAKSFNNELGFPLAIIGNWQEIGGYFFWLKVILFGIVQIIFKKRSYPEILVLEYGIDRPGDMKYLLEIARPQVGVITAIGKIPVHIEYFAGKEQLLKEKAKLINQLPATGFAILNADDIAIYKIKDRTRAQVITFGFTEKADMRITTFKTIFSKRTAAVSFKLNYGGSFIPVHLENILGKTKGYTSAAAALVGLVFGINLVTISETLAGYYTPPGRMKILKGIKNSWIIDDTYNAAPLATEAALCTLKDLKAKRKIAVLGDMLEIGKYTAEAHEKVGQLAGKFVDVLITIGMRSKFISKTAGDIGMTKNNIHHFGKASEAGKFLQNEIKEGDVILIKASQAVRLEKIVKEVMAEPDRARELLVRQNKKWLTKRGSYESR